MSTLQNKVDFVALVSVTQANSNGDPLNGNRPRTNLDGFGEISDVCIKRKIRNRMQDMGQHIFVQSEDRCDDGYGSLSERASATMKNVKDRDEYAKLACKTWLDVRSFGQVFAFKDAKGLSVGVRGPISVHQASSVSAVDIESIQITKSVNGEKKAKDTARSSDTMGMKHYVRFGRYKIKGSINVQLPEKTGFSEKMPKSSKSACAPCSSMTHPPQDRTAPWRLLSCSGGSITARTVNIPLQRFTAL